MIRDLLEQANDIQTKLNLLEKAKKQMQEVMAGAKYETHQLTPSPEHPRGKSVTMIIFEDPEALLKLKNILS